MAIFDFFRKKYTLAESGMFQGATDCHSHILPCMDDGVSSLEETLSILSYAELLGIREWWCTSHVMEDNPSYTDDLKAVFAEVCEAYKGPIKLRLAAEYMLDTEFEKRLKQKDLLLMDDDTVLVEASVISAPYDLAGMLQDIMSAGYRPLLAHPERYRYLTLQDYGKLHDMGVHFQLNLGSVTGYYGKDARKKAEYLLDKGWYNAAGSDCHRLRSLQHQVGRKTVTGKVIRQVRDLINKKGTI